MSDAGHTADEVVLLRRELDRQYTERLAHLEEQLNIMESQFNDDLADMKTNLHRLTLDLHDLVMRQTDHEPIMQSLERIVGAGIVLRWTVIFIIGALAAIGTAATAWESLQRWLR